MDENESLKTTVPQNMKDSIAVLITDNCLDALKTIRNSSVDLILTSPPYADARKNQYGGAAPDQYVTWFAPIAQELKRILKKSGTLVMQIKEKVVDGERHTYLHDLIAAMRSVGWLWTEEWIFHKKTAAPGKWPNRFRDAFDRVLQFNLDRHFKMNQDAVMVPAGDALKRRLANLSETDSIRSPSATGSPISRKISNWLGREAVYPSNVLHMASECANKQHPAASPVSLFAFFVKLFSNAGDVVLDPFSGSGATGVAAVQLGRKYIGIDHIEQYNQVAARRIASAQRILEDAAQDDAGGTDDAVNPDTLAYPWDAGCGAPVFDPPLVLLEEDDEALTSTGDARHDLAVAVRSHVARLSDLLTANRYLVYDLTPGTLADIEAEMADAEDALHTYRAALDAIRAMRAA